MAASRLLFGSFLAIAAMPFVSCSPFPNLGQACVLESDNKLSCNYFENYPLVRIQLPAASRPIHCDDKCLNEKVLEITNKIRCKHGKCTKVKSGPKIMLENAKGWSEHQQSSGMKHQKPLPKLRCGVAIGAENVAMFAGIDNDPAEQCMKQWENSKAHLDNILNAGEGDMMCAGFSKRGEKIYCTQTFSNSKPKNDGSDCRPLTDTAGALRPNQAAGESQPEITTASDHTTPPTTPLRTNPSTTEALETMPVSKAQSKNYPIATKPPNTTRRPAITYEVHSTTGRSKETDAETHGDNLVTLKEPKRVPITTKRPAITYETHSTMKYVTESRAETVPTTKSRTASKSDCAGHGTQEKVDKANIDQGSRGQESAQHPKHYNDHRKSEFWKKLYGHRSDAGSGSEGNEQQVRGEEWNGAFGGERDENWDQWGHQDIQK